MAGTQFIWEYQTRGSGMFPRGIRLKLLIRPSGPRETSWTTVEIPDDAVNIPTLTDLAQVSFGDIPIGMPEAPQWKFQFKMSRLATGSLTTLRDKLLKETYYHAGSALPQVPRDFATTNFFQLLWDEGTGGEPTTVLFQGVQWRPQESDGRSRPTTKESWIDIEVVDINKAVMETVIPMDVQMYFFDSYLKSQHLPNWGLHGSANTYDTLYRDDGLNYGRVQRLKADPTRVELARFWSIAKLFEVIAALCRSAYRHYVRDATASYSFIGPGSGNTPYDVFRFYKQTYALSSGAIARGSLLGDGSIYFIGIVWRDGTVVDTYPDDVPNIIGGFLSEYDKTGLFSYDNMWEFISACCSGCKTQYTYADDPGMTITFARPGERSATRTLRGSDILKVGLGGTDVLEIPYTLRAGMVGSVEVATKGLGDADELQSTVSVAFIPPSAASGPNIEFPFHNLPSIGDSTDRYFLNPDDDTAASQDIETPYLICASSGFVTNCLYYWEWPGNDLITHSDQIPIRVHDQVEWEWTSSITYNDGENVAGYPGDVANIENPLLIEGLDDLFWNPLKALYATIQNSSCLLFIVGYRLVYNFSRDGQLSFEIETSIEKAPPFAIGDYYDLQDENGDSIPVNELLGLSTTADLGTEAFYLSGEFQIENPTVVATFLILGND